VDIGYVAEQRIEAAAEQRDRTPAGSPEPERKYSFLNILHAAISGRRQTRAAHILCGSFAFDACYLGASGPRNDGTAQPKCCSR
jgi:hypothetical protein